LVRHAEYHGSHWVADLDTPAGALKAVVDRAGRPREGDGVGVAFDAARTVLFDAATERLLPSAATAAHRPGIRHG
jgi:multiple sugar transport system ATP-binding protein